MMDRCVHSKEVVEQAMHEFYIGSQTLEEVCSRLEMSLLQLRDCLERMDLINDDVREQIDALVEEEHAPVHEESHPDIS